MKETRLHASGCPNYKLQKKYTWKEKGEPTLKKNNREKPKWKQRLKEIWELQILGENSGDIKKIKRNSIFLLIFLFLFVYWNVFDG